MNNHQSHPTMQEGKQEQKILSDRLQLLNKHLRTSIPIAFVCTSLIFAAVYPVINTTLIITWYILSIVVYIFRFALYQYYKATPNNLHLHIRLFIIGSCLSALILGAAGTLLMPKGYFLHQTIIIVIIAGITAGSMQTLQPSRLASSLYIIFAILPLDIWLFLHEDRTYILLGISMIGYMGFMLNVSKNGYEMINSTLKLRYENDIINERLAKINLKLIADIDYHEKYEKSLAQLAAIVEYSKDAIIGLDTHGIIQTWNQGAEALYGYSSKEIIGKTITILSAPGQQDILESLHAQVLNESSMQNIELERRHKDGHLIPVSITLSPIKNLFGVMMGISSMDRDITEQKAVLRLKNDFISMVSHELRTPLTSIKGAIGLLLSNIANTDAIKMKQLLEIAYNNCERLIRLINDILDIEKIESGNIQFKFTLINIKELIQQAITENTAYAEKFQVTLIFLNAIDAHILGDHDRLLQVMTNLISNAVKFSHTEGTVEIVMEKYNNRVKISVIDHGSGIPLDYRTKIFEKFTQADSTSTRTKGGTGLGLSISKAILQAHHSKICFTTEENKGSTFYFELALANEAMIN